MDKDHRMTQFYKLFKHVAQREDLSPTQKLIFTVLVDRMDRKGMAWPGYKRIARDVGVSRASAIRAIKGLERLGALRVERPGRNKSNRYQIGTGHNLQLVPDCDPDGINLQPEVVSKCAPIQTKGIRLNNQTQTGSETDPSRTPGGEAFNRFWEAYPVKIKKAGAAGVWRKLNPDPGLIEQIMAALDRQKRSAQWTKDGGRYIPHAHNWLDGRRWEDELPAGTEGGDEEGGILRPPQPRNLTPEEREGLFKDKPPMAVREGGTTGQPTTDLEEKQ